jgi:hypothetical protein
VPIFKTNTSQIEKERRKKKLTKNLLFIIYNKKKEYKYYSEFLLPVILFDLKFVQIIYQGIQY